MNHSASRFHRKQTVIEGLTLATSCWLIIAVAIVIWPPHWPEAQPILRMIDGRLTLVGRISAFEAWRGQLATFLISYFLFLKLWLMFRRSRFYDRLGVSVIAVNFCFAMLYELSVAWALWPSLQSHRWTREIIINVLILVIIWGLFELVMTEDRP